MTQAPDQQSLTEEERDVVRSAAIRAGAAVASAEPGFFDTFKESFAASRAVKAAPPEVRELVSTGGLPEMPKGDKAAVESRTMELLQQAGDILRTKAPHLFDDYRAVVVQSARDVAAAADDVSAAETDVIARIEQALGGSAV